jgi:hypothetical protein
MPVCVPGALALLSRWITAAVTVINHDAVSGSIVAAGKFYRRQHLR